MVKTEIRAEPGKQEIVLERVFDAPRELVFRAFTDPTLIPRWWGPRKYMTIVDEMDVRPGGRWRFLNRDGEGNDYGFHGVYHDSVAPEWLVQTFEFEGAPGHVSLETATFTEVGGQTKFRGVTVFQSVEARDAMVASGMEEGARETWERFAELLAQLTRENVRA